jgi:hypothetical protein
MNTVYVVHCIDTEGPLHESLTATFQRIKNTFEIELAPTQENLRRLQNKEIDLDGLEDAVAQFVRPQLLSYNDTWDKINEMLIDVLGEKYRCKLLDSFGNGWIYNWFCVDHVGYEINPRRRDIGYHNVFDHYDDILTANNSEKDGLHFHYHPMPLNRHANVNATHYFAHSDTLYQILAQRIIDRNWFPCAYRPGFHVIRPDSHWFLEQFIPFDFSNQACDQQPEQIDLAWGRFGDWRRAPKTWQPFHPDHDDYQIPGKCRRWIMRCLNIGTRHSCVTQEDVNRAFLEAAEGKPVILAFTDHDFRDIRRDIEAIREMLVIAKSQFPNVTFRFCEAREAVRLALGLEEKAPPHLKLKMQNNRLRVTSDSPIFGPQPFLAIKTMDGHYYHDNLDFQEPFREWSYVFDVQTFFISMIEKVGVGACDETGNVTVANLDIRTLNVKEVSW